MARPPVNVLQELSLAACRARLSQSHAGTESPPFVTHPDEAMPLQNHGDCGFSAAPTWLEEGSCTRVNAFPPPATLC